MNEIMIFVLVAIGGFFLGIIFFGGLWLTVSNSLHFKSPAGWFIMSFILRTGITLAGFYYMCGDQWQRLVSCLFGFIVARVIITKLTNTSAHSKLTNGKEVNHET